MRTVSRRSLLKAGVAAPVLLSACGSPANESSRTGSKADLPKYMAFNGPAPDLPAGSEAATNVYLTYPRELKQAVAEKPGDGSTIRLMLDTSTPPPAPLGQNEWWKAINDKLGVTLELNLTPADQYSEKFAVVMAGGDLPDLMFIDAFAFPPRFEEFVVSQCQDLSEYLSGDAISDYPNLANLPTYAWQAQGRFKGGIFSVPVARSLISNSLMVNRTLLAAAGAPIDWTRDDFTAALKNVSVKGRWGLTHTPFWHDAVHAASHGAPNWWRADSGQFTPMYSTEQYKTSLEYARTLWEAGSYHPDSLSLTAPNKQTLFVNQTLVGNPDGVTAVSALMGRINGAFDLDFAKPYQAPGAKPTWFTGAGAFGRILLKKAPKARIEMLLRVLNYLAAPFGTTEYELIRYGVEGIHFTRKSTGAPTKTDAATAQNPSIQKISGGVPPFEGWAFPDVARKLHAWQAEIASQALKDPAKANGLRSATASRSGATLDNLIKDAVNAVVTGQKPMSFWDETVKKWRNEGGDKIAAEYSESLASQK